jgi:hypothetical protein
MMYFRSLEARISVLFTIPLGFATGMLAATIAVGGFIGVPGMHYVLGAPSLMASATELVIAFVMGLGGTIKFAWSGLVDIRLAMIILAGSLFGIQLGAIGTTYVRPHMIKVVMGTIMLLVLVSRALVIPVYLSELQLIAPLGRTAVKVLQGASFAIMVLGLAAGAFIILSALRKGLRAEHEARVLAMPVPAAAPLPGALAQLSPLGRFERFLVASDGSEYSAGAEREALRLAQRCGARVRMITFVAGSENEARADPRGAGRGARAPRTGRRSGKDRRRRLRDRGRAGAQRARPRHRGKRAHARGPDRRRAPRPPRPRAHDGGRCDAQADRRRALQRARGAARRTGAWPAVRAGIGRLAVR